MMFTKIDLLCCKCESSPKKYTPLSSLLGVHDTSFPKLPIVSYLINQQHMSTPPVSYSESFRRGLEHARKIKDQAREEYKLKRQQEMQTDGTNLNMCMKNDPSLSPDEKYRRRLAKNQESAAATRYANEVYLKQLELQVRAYDIDMTNIENIAGQVEKQRNDNCRLNSILHDQKRRMIEEIHRLRAELPLRDTSLQCLPQSEEEKVERDEAESAFSIPEFLFDTE